MTKLSLRSVRYSKPAHAVLVEAWMPGSGPPFDKLRMSGIARLKTLGSDDQQLFSVQLQRAGLAVGLSLLSSSSVFAQAAVQEILPDTIIVTARGRAEIAARVPETLTILTTSLTARRLDTTGDILNAAPGVLFVSDTDPGTNVISIRGISTNRGQDPSVAVIFDDHILPDSELFTLKPLDLARAEIIKGPQGALFGKSAAGGAVHFVSRAPGTGGNYVRAGGGNGGSIGFSGVADAKLSPTAALRFAADFSDSTGFIRNRTLRKKVDGFQSLNLKLAVLFDSESLEIAPSVRYTREKGGAAFVSSNNVTQKFGGRLAGAALTDPVGDFEGRSDRHYFGASLSLAHDFGGVKLRSTTSYDDYQKNFIEELDFRPEKPLTFFGFPAFPAGIQPIAQPVDLTAWTQEIRLTSPGTEKVRWIVGGFYQHLNKLRTDDFTGFGTYLAERQTSTQTALFASLDADITPDITVSGALRYDRVKKTQDQRDRQNLRIGMRSGTFDSVQPKLSLAYRPSADLMIYASASTGYKPGGFNPPSALAPSAPASFAGEKTRGAELGFKLGAENLHLTAAAFVARHDNFQNTVFLDNNLVFSIQRVNIRGVEATLDYAVTRAFSVDASASFTRARLGRYTVANPTIETPEPLVQCRVSGGSICDFTGNRIAYSPSMTLHAGSNWQVDVGGVTLLLRADITHTGKIYYETDNMLYSPARTQIDARVALARDNIDVAFWAKNIGNTRAALAAFGQQNLLLLNALGPGGPYDSFTISKRRQFGADLTIRF